MDDWGDCRQNVWLCLEREHGLPSQQMGCPKGSRRTKDQLLIDTTVLQDCKIRH